MKIRLKDKVVSCEVKSTSEGIKNGMMRRGRLEGCMLFILPFKGEQNFWMKDCLLALDIVFCEDNTITAIYKSCPPCEEEPCPSYTGFGNIVLEFKGGFCEENQLKIGDSFSVIS